MTEDEQLNWNEIVNQYGERVFRIAKRILRSVHDAEDVSQEVFVEAYRLHQTDSIRSWAGLLVRLATLRSLDRLRRNRPSVKLRDQDRMTVVEPFDELSAKELAHNLRDAIAQLPEQQATVFSLIQLEKLSRTEVAESLGISPKAVSTTLYKARQQLKSHFSVLNGGKIK